MDQCLIQMRKPEIFGLASFAFVESLNEHLIFSQSVQAFPAMGVARDLFPASPHWSHTGSRDASLPCQQLMWCSTDRLVSSLFILFPVFQTWILEDGVGMKRRSYFTLILTTAWSTKIDLQIINGLNGGSGKKEQARGLVDDVHRGSKTGPPTM